MEVSSAKAGLPESHICRTYAIARNRSTVKEKKRKKLSPHKSLYKQENNDREVARLMVGSSEFHVKFAL